MSGSQMAAGEKNETLQL